MPAPQPPVGGAFKTGHRHSRGGQRLHTVECWPVAWPPKAVVVFHHGLSEHCGRYQHVANAYAASGIGFVSYDIYNHGRSDSQEDGDRGYLESFEQLVDDLKAFAADVRKLVGDESTPMFLEGQSMGGLVAAHVAAQQEGLWAGLILNSPLINVEWNLVMQLQSKVAGFLSWAAPRAKMVPAVNVKDMSQDPAVCRAIEEDPLMVHGDIRVKTSYTLLQAFTKFQDSYADINLPVLSIMGNMDKCTSLSALRTFMAAISSKDKVLDVIKGGYHELLMGPEKEDVLHKTTDWILQRASSASLPARM